MMIGMRQSAHRAQGRLLAALMLPVGIVALSWMPISGGAAVAQDSATPTPIAAGVLGDPATDTGCSLEIGATPEADVAAAFQIVSDQSLARYRVEEELAGRGAAEAVGETNAFIGTIFLDDQGIPIPCSRFDVDIRTLKSDEARRDNYLYRNTLESERYPLATFIVTGIEGLPDPLPEGQDTTLTLIGNLTLHGVTKLVAWEATVRLDGKTLKGTAWTQFEMPDFAITPPKVGPVVGLDETVRLEVEVTAHQIQE